ncbi:MAG: aminotransferase class IV [Peptococcaceae bacterium]|jgi:aminodeoxychorismate lyase|nr:aminotransferase class IV [Peptococcaceae bacterium]MDH7524844.1 aminotransferase class IV [Peptococcaceae bacterium]
MSYQPYMGRIINGKPLPGTNLSISCWDKGILYGYGLFETMRVHRKTILALEEHLQRLASSCHRLNIVDNLFWLDLKSIVQEYVITTNLEEGALRLSITKGDPSKGVEPLFFLTSRDLSYSPQDYEKGFRAVVSPHKKNETSLLVYHKTLNNLENIMVLEESRRKGANEALFLNTNHLLTEGTMSNLFFVYGRTIFTPSISCGLLNGITRQTVIRLASDMGYRVIEGEYALDNLLTATEAFLTNSLMEIMPLVKIENQYIDRGKPGRVTRELLHYYQKLTRNNCL